MKTLYLNEKTEIEISLNGYYGALEDLIINQGEESYGIDLDECTIKENTISRDIGEYSRPEYSRSYDIEVEEITSKIVSYIDDNNETGVVKLDSELLDRINYLIEEEAVELFIKGLN
jgi:hypothetical protein